MSSSFIKFGRTLERCGLTLACGCVFFGAFVASGDSIEARHDLGDLSTLESWSGLDAAPGEGPDGTDAARLAAPGEAEFRYPEEGWTEAKGRRLRRNPAGGIVCGPGIAGLGTGGVRP